MCGILPWVRTQCHVREYVGESEGVGEGKGWRVYIKVGVHCSELIQ